MTLTLCLPQVMSSGLRIGWVSGATPFIKRIILHQQSTVIHPSTLGQVNLVDRLYSVVFKMKKIIDFPVYTCKKS